MATNTATHIRSKKNKSVRKKPSSENISPEKMRADLLAWNPGWQETTVFGFKPEQLVAIYKKERKKIVDTIFIAHGLQPE